MTAWVYVPPLSVRARECACCNAVINTIADMEIKLNPVKNPHRIHQYIKGQFSDRAVQMSLPMLENAGFVTMNYAKSTKGDPVPSLTDEGWAIADADKPLWLA